MGLNWIESGSSVAVGALIGTLPGVIAIVNENRRFDARAEAVARRPEYDDLRECLAVLASCFSAWGFAASVRFEASGSQNIAKKAQINQIVADANGQYQRTIGRILTNPRAEKYQPEYEAAVTD
jgi:hypothetical protein